jgi:hypothetical protein
VYFVSTSGFISIYNPTNFDVISRSANKVEKTLTPSGTYISGSAYDGSTDRTWTINGTSTWTVGQGNNLVARDGSGNVYVNNIYASTGITGVASSATSLVVNSSYYATGSTGTTANTIAARDGNGNIWANYFIGTATKALYADLAENYLSDAPYEAGTVLEFGGDFEVTIAEDGTRRVAGVVSTDPAYLMNTGLAGDNVVAVALTGRVPVKVRGKINKGDMLISGGNGYARAEYSPVLGSVIGKALENFNGIEGVIEVVVGRL